MTPDDVADPLDPPAVDGAGQEAKQFASELISQWPKETPFDAHVVLEQHPELHDYKSIVIDLAYEEYCRQLEAGTPVAPEEFAQRFPTVEKSLIHLLEVDRFLDLAGEFPRDQATIEWPEVGDTFLDFLLVESLGRGAFSRVFLAREKTLGDRTVVVKICYRGGAEANMLGKLQHPNIVSVYSVHDDPDSGLTAICMPYWGRTTLADVLDAVHANRAAPASGSIAPEKEAKPHTDATIPALKRNLQSIFRRGSYLDAILEIGAQLADGLAFTHEAGIFHRDIKPSNALITADGRALLLDFNLSSSEMTESWMVAGTLPYMAPEQLEAVSATVAGAKHTFDARTDLFQLGVMLYELLAGHLPFGRIEPTASLKESAAAVLQKQRGGPQPLTRSNPDVDRQLAKLIESTLAIDPQLRPASAAAFARSLRTQLSRLSRFRRWGKRHPGRLAGAVTGVILTIAGVGYAIAMIPPDRVREEQRGWTAFEQGNNESAARHFGRVLDLEPNDWDIRFARGRAYAAAGEFESAHRDFKWLEDHQVEDGRISAMIGYCLCRMNYYNSAIVSFKRAVHQGFANAAVYNDLGFCCAQTNLPGDVDGYLRKALELDGNSQAAYFNLACIEYRAAMGGNRCPKLEFLEKALELGPHTAELEYCAATTWALAKAACPVNPQEPGGTSTEEILDACQRAINLGLDPAAIRTLRVTCPELQNSQRFERLCKSARVANARWTKSEGRIVDPMFGTDRVELQKVP